MIEKDGRIRLIKSGALLETPFLDITALVSKGHEQGLLGLAFHPGYATTVASSSTTPTQRRPGRLELPRVGRTRRRQSRSEPPCSFADEPSTTTTAA